MESMERVVDIEGNYVVDVGVLLDSYLLSVLNNFSSSVLVPYFPPVLR